MLTAEQLSVGDLSELEVWTRKLGVQLPGRLVVLLHGEPGAGKTEFVKAFVNGICLNAGERCKVEVSSPTFALHHSYELGLEFLETVDHWDLYRLEGEDDLESSGFWDQFSASRFLIFIEWPERLREAWLPRDVGLWRIEIQRVNQGAEPEVGSRRSIRYEVLQREV
jgi:tRNA threonylcarbamoyladenosine biosynthesis protein TsaE